MYYLNLKNLWAERPFCTKAGETVPDQSHPLQPPPKTFSFARRTQKDFSGIEKLSDLSKRAFIRSPEAAW